MPDTRFQDRIVYITGAASGVGRATATLFAAEGAKVFVADVSQEGLNETISAIRDAGGNVDGGLCNVASMESVRSSIGSAVERFGGLHVLINAAGVGRAARFEEIDEAEWNRVIGVNLTGAFHTTKVAIEHLLQTPNSSIVNVASIAGLRGQAYNSHYCASKAGLLNFTRSLALEFATRGLRANCVCPGGVNTPLIRNFVPQPDYEKRLVGYYMPPAPHMMGMPEDIARTIAFLASDDARMVNGAALVADFGTLA
jgi:meso-butanediol dehydrogenase / (S,S)-butanediol dehydrogenase / diacetyl reductase